MSLAYLLNPDFASQVSAPSPGPRIPCCMQMHCLDRLMQRAAAAGGQGLLSLLSRSPAFFVRNSSTERSGYLQITTSTVQDSTALCSSVVYFSIVQYSIV